MKCITQSEEIDWLAEHRVPAAPYAQDCQGFDFYLQFYPPQNFRGVEAFTKILLPAASAAGDILLSILDTEQPESYELRLIERLRSASKESRSITEAPGHLFSSEEEDDVVAMFSLTIALGWEVYLYMPKTRSVMLNWEGDILDFWTSDRAVFDEVKRLVGVFKLPETKKPNQTPHPTTL